MGFSLFLPLVWIRESLLHKISDSACEADDIVLQQVEKEHMTSREEEKSRYLRLSTVPCFFSFSLGMLFVVCVPLLSDGMPLFVAYSLVFNL